MSGKISKLSEDIMVQQHGGPSLSAVSHTEMKLTKQEIYKSFHWRTTMGWTTMGFTGAIIIVTRLRPWHVQGVSYSCSLFTIPPPWSLLPPPSTPFPPPPSLPFPSLPPSQNSDATGGTAWQGVTEPANPIICLQSHWWYVFRAEWNHHMSWDLSQTTCHRHLLL